MRPQQHDAILDFQIIAKQLLFLIFGNKIHLKYQNCDVNQ